MTQADFAPNGKLNVHPMTPLLTEPLYLESIKACKSVGSFRLAA